MQGNPGEGKTTFALRLAAACTTGGTLPGMKPLLPFHVIYQTAEDGLGDTVKPRLIEAEADLDRVLVIDEAKREQMCIRDSGRTGAEVFETDGTPCRFYRPHPRHSQRVYQQD